MDRQTGIDRKMDNIFFTDGQTYKHSKTDEWSNRQMERQTGGWMDGHGDGLLYEQT